MNRLAGLPFAQGASTNAADFSVAAKSGMRKHARAERGNGG